MVRIKGLNIGSGRPKICAPLIGAVREEVLREAVLAREAGADLVEWRVDHYRKVFLLMKLQKHWFLSMRCLMDCRYYLRSVP